MERAEFRWRCWDEYIRCRGSKYDRCRLENFQMYEGKEGADQLRVVRSLHRFSDDARFNFNAGTGIVLYGSVGTGKDHLISGTLYHCLLFGMIDDARKRKIDNVLWFNGPNLFGQIRKGIATGFDNILIERLKRVHLLILSDLVIPGISLTSFQQQTIYEIIDERYSQQKPTWFSTNHPNRQSLEHSIGQATVDRILENANILKCAWESYRTWKSRKDAKDEENRASQRHRGDRKEQGGEHIPSA